MIELDTGAMFSKLANKKPVKSYLVTITIFSNFIGALTALFFTNYMYCVGL